jgi:hypothetical protein
MTTAIKQITVGDFIQELQNSPSDTPITLKDDYGENFRVVSFEVADDRVNIIITDDDEEDSDDEPVKIG